MRTFWAIVLGLLVVLGIMVLLAVIAARMATPARSQPLPVPKEGSCPSGYTQSGGFCAPMASQRCRAIPKPKNGQCPSDWRQSGDYCQETKCR